MNISHALYRTDTDNLASVKMKRILLNLYSLHLFKFMNYTIFQPTIEFPSETFGKRMCYSIFS